MKQVQTDNIVNGSSTQLIDSLTGCWNRVRSIDFLAEVMSDPLIVDWSVVGIDLNQCKKINDFFGHAAGDKLLQWIAEKLKKDCPRCCRTGGDEFILFFVESGHEIHNQKAKALYENINQDLPLFFEENKFDLDRIQDFLPVLTLSIFNVSKNSKIEMEKLFSLLDYSIYELKKEYRQKNIDLTYGHFDAKEIMTKVNSVNTSWVTEYLLQRVSDLSKALAASNTIALTDHVSGLPNALAAENYINNILVKTNPQHEKICLFLIDGDDLKQYNLISYQAGDEMIRNLAGLLTKNIHNTEFLGRWRMGDEFVMIFPGVSLMKGKIMAEELRNFIEQETIFWQIPVTISIGLACYPDHGENLDDLLEHAEKCLSLAKHSGKNQVVQID